MKKCISMALIIVCALTVVLSGCTDNRQTEKSETADSDKIQESRSEENEIAEQNDMEEENMNRKIIVEVNGSRFTATLENNKAADTLAETIREEPVTIRMNDYSGFEKVGSLGTNLPTSNRQTTTQAGDIVLYQGNQIVIFYGSNSWSYTRLGKIDDLTGWKDALGSGDVTVIFSPEES